MLYVVTNCLAPVFRITDLMISLFFCVLAQSNLCSTVIRRWWVGSVPGPATFLVIYHEICSMVILSLQLTQEGQLSVSGKRMCTRTG